MAFVIFGGILAYTIHAIVLKPWLTGQEHAILIIALTVTVLALFISLHKGYFGGSSTSTKDTGIRIGGMAVTRETSSYSAGLGMTPYRRAAYYFAAAVLLFHVYMLLGLFGAVPWLLPWAGYFDLEKILGI